MQCVRTNLKKEINGQSKKMIQGQKKKKSLFQSIMIHLILHSETLSSFRYFFNLCNVN